MDGVQEVTAGDAGSAAAPAPAPVATRPRRSPRRDPRRRTLAFDLTALALVGVLLIGAIGATGAVMYRQLYSPEAFVTRYLELLGAGRAADALALPGVAVDSIELEEAGLSATATEALLRPAAMTTLTDIEIVASEQDGATTRVTASYSAGPHSGTTTFEVERAGSVGLLPTWRFASTPLAMIDLTVRGAMEFSVNGFTIDKRQVSVDGLDADPLAPIPLLVFSPGLYSISVDTPLSASPGVAVLSDKPRADIPIDLQTVPTEEFVAVVQEKVDQFLTDCATQQVLQPTGCPFGFMVQNRIVEAPTWSIAQQPVVTLSPDGANWNIERAEAVAHIQVDIQSIYDGSIRHVDEDVPFFLDGDITILADGTASIQVSAAE